MATFRHLVQALREAERRDQADPEDLLGWDEEPFLAPVVLDVRSRAEFRSGHLRGAWNLPGRISVEPGGETCMIKGEVQAEPPRARRLGALRRLPVVPAGLGGLPAPRPVVRAWSAILPPPTAKIALWVHCADGSRARVAAGVLAGAGYEVAYVEDDLRSAAAAGVVRLTSFF